MGIEEDFYATVKLKSGEEIFAKVAASEEEDMTMLIISNPIIISEIKGRMGILGYKFDKSIYKEKRYTNSRRSIRIIQKVTTHRKF